MIARLTVAVPFAIAVPDGATYAGYGYKDGEYEIVYRPPGKSDQPLKMDVPTELEIDGVKGFMANAIRFDFHKSDFDRKRGSDQYDPPMELMRHVVANFIARLRYVTRAPHVQPIDFPRGTIWHLQYLNDDETELAQDPALIRNRRGWRVSFAYTSLPPSVWELMHELDSDWKAPVWDDILLDAFHALPSIGTAVVLGATSLEVFIAEVLDRLAPGSDVPPAMWHWINDRKDWRLDPTTEEQFDALLKHFTGHSLKERPKLWQDFRDLRTARNKFVHEGSPLVGGTPIGLQRAGELLMSATEIVSLVRTWLPEEKRWPQFDPRVEIRLVLPLLDRDGAPPGGPR